MQVVGGLGVHDQVDAADLVLLVDAEGHQPVHDDTDDAGDDKGVHEHHAAADGYLPAPIVMAAAVAGRTRNVQLQLGLMVLTLPDPLHAAEQLAVRDLVLVTKAHEGSTHPDAPLLVDIDLSILGASAERFFEYEDQIRQEYAWVPEDIFRTKRAEILERFLDRDVIYRTPKFYQTHEKQARANLRASLERLRR